MATEGPQLSLLQRREIEARIVGPLLRAVAAELGHEKTLALARGVISELAREAGADLALRFGEATLETFARSLDLWREGGALEIEMIEQSAERLSFNVTRCRYAEMYRALGLADLGSSLSCQRDFSLVEGFNPAIGLTRTQTLMEGASHCDFRFVAPGPSEPDRVPADERGPT
jgi:L-2-amino-thiazoline-4-carboxylic acid hydrolase